MRLVPSNMFKPSSNFLTDRSEAGLLLWILFVIWFRVCFCYTVLSVTCSLVVTCWERDDLSGMCFFLAFLSFVTFPYDAQRRKRALMGRFSHFQFFDIFQKVYVQVIDLCTFRSEIIHVSAK